MNIEKHITGDSILIVPNLIKKKVLNYLTEKNQLFQIKIMSLEEWQKHYFFSYDAKTIDYCLTKYSLKYDIIIEYLNTLPFIKEKNYNHPKLIKLTNLKKELQNKNLLITDPYFHYYIKNKNIIIYGYPDLAPFYEDLFSKLPNVTIILEEASPKQELTVSKFTHIDEEIAYVASQIVELINSGVSINNIKLTNVTAEYKKPLKRIMNWFKLPINIENDSTLYDSPVGQKALQLIAEKTPFNIIIQRIEKDFPNSPLINDIISIFNNYLWLKEDNDNRLLLLKKDFKKKKLSSPKLKNSLDIINLDELTDDYYFLLGFNAENLPKTVKDEEIINNTLKKELGLFTSDEINKQNKQHLKNILYQTSKLTITLKEKTSFDSYNPSLLIEEEKMIITEPKPLWHISNTYNQIALTKYLDELNKYGIYNDELVTLYPLYKNIPYLSYDNKYTGINQEDLSLLLNNKLILSYSSLDNFYRCRFRYYLANILKIDPFESTFYTKIGTIFHNVLRVCFNDDFEFEKTFNQELSNYDFTKSELLLLTKLKEELIFDINTIKKQKKLTNFDEAIYEHKFYKEIENKYSTIKVTLMGIIDKIMMLKKDNHTLVSIIDYKTGYLPDNLNNVIHGIGMQLPMYYYLVKTAPNIIEPKLVGIYLQKIVNKELKRDLHSSYLEQKEKTLKLVGYSTDNEYYLEQFDFSYQDSALIKSLKKGKSGFYQYSKVLNDNQFSKLYNIINDRVEEAATNILKADFTINPKQIGKENIGCSFCKYKDICFYKEEDIVYLQEYKNLSFLGGEKDAKMD